MDGQSFEQNIHFVFPTIKAFFPVTTCACEFTLDTKYFSNRATSHRTPHPYNLHLRVES